MDPTESADQPFLSPAPSLWLACNGEIYNAGDLRRRFASYPFRTHTDIEPLLPAYQALGINLFRELDGMFAIALWDPSSGTLALARDRAGEKPLHYAWIGGDFWFASEIQALLQHPALGRDIDHVAVSQYLTLGYPLEPRTLFANVRRVESGTVFRVSTSGAQVDRYWRPRGLLRTRVDARAADDVRELGRLVEGAVRRQVVADAPVGVFLSGGLDSSLIAAVASRALGRDAVTTLTARFDSPSYDEGDWAASCARNVGTRHVDVPCGNEQLLRAVRNVAARVAEPISDPAVLPTFLLAESASQRVRVVLSGEGADELFGGYPTYLGHRIADTFARAPHPLKSALVRLAEALPVSDRKVSFDYLVKRFATGVGLAWPERHVAWFGSGGGVTLAKAGSTNWLGPLLDGYRDLDALPGAMLLDYESYLRDNLLVKMDRATMLNSIEGRAPFLDAELSKFAFGLSPRRKLRRTTTKWLLKQAAAQWVPRAQRVRVKRGLSVPIAEWLNGGLRESADRLLARERLERHGLVNSAEVQRLLQSHRSGAANNARALWTVVMLQLWLERWQPVLSADDPLGLRDVPTSPSPVPPLRRVVVPEIRQWSSERGALQG
jgi:asparagine synthase (glutamine-hydrolysing)